MIAQQVQTIQHVVVLYCMNASIVIGAISDRPAGPDDTARGRGTTQGVRL